MEITETISSPLRTMCKGEINRAMVTEANLGYAGSTIVSANENNHITKVVKHALLAEGSSTI